MSLLARYLLFPFVYVLLWAIFLACVVGAVWEMLRNLLMVKAT